MTTLMLGRNCGSDCDPCCSCGPFCSNGYCGADMNWNATLSGASVGGVNAGGCACTDLNASIGVRGLLGAPAVSQSAEDWNAFELAWVGRDAKSGTKVCSWNESDTLSSSCSGGTSEISSAVVSAYMGVDDKWYLVFAATHLDGSATATIAGEAEFSGGGAAMDCGTPGEGSPTFSLSITLSAYDASTGYADECNGPTSVLIEGDPQ